MAKKEIDFVIKVNNKDLDLSKTSLKQFNAIIVQAKKDLAALPLNDPRYKILSKDIKMAEESWKAAKKASQEFNDEQEEGGGKVLTYSQQIRIATRELISLEQQFGKNSKQYQDQAEKVKSLRDEQEELTRGTQKLDDALSNIPGPIGQIGQGLQQLEQISGSAKSAFNSLGLGFKSLDQAIKTSGVGLLVLLIVSLVAAVVDAAKSFKPLQNAFAAIQDSVGALFNALKPITDFLLNVFVGALKIVAGAINLVAEAFGGVNNGAAQASLELERNIKKQESLLSNYGQAIDGKLKEIISAYKEFSEKKKKILDDDYQNEADRQGDIKILQLGYINFLKQNLAEREKLVSQFETDVDKFVTESEIRKTDNQRKADRLSTEMQKKFIGETSRNELDYQKAKLKALKDDEAVLRTLTTENAKEALKANLASQNLLNIEMLKLETKGFNDFVAIQEEQDKKQRQYTRDDIAARNQRANQIIELTTSLIKEENARNLQAAKDKLVTLKEDQRLELEQLTLSGLSTKNLREKQAAELKVINEDIRKAQIQFDANTIQLQINEEQRNLDEELTRDEQFYQRKRDLATTELEKDFKLADGNFDKEEQARTKHFQTILEIDKEELGNITSNLELEYEGMYQVSADAFQKLREIEEAKYKEQQRGNEQNYQLIQALAKDHAKKMNMIDVQELNTMADLLQRRADARNDLLTRYFLKAREAEDLYYAARVKAAGDNVELLEVIEEEHLRKIRDLNDQKLDAFGKVVSATLDSLANLSAALGSIYEAESQNTKKTLAERKDAFEKNKKFQLATAYLSAASGIIQILTQPSTLPSPFDWITKGINALALGVVTAVQISKIKSTTFESGSGGASGGGAEAYNGLGRNYGDGGMIDGPSHNSPQGGVPIMAEGGEAVMTRGSVTMFGPLLSAMNQMGGGRAFNPSVYGAANFDNPRLSTPSAESAPMVLKTYVVSSDMTSEQHKQSRLKDLSTL
jgi:hypothetical protein